MIPLVRGFVPRFSGYQDLVPPCVPEFDAATSLISPRRLTSGFVQLLDAMALLVIIGSSSQIAHRVHFALHKNA